MEKNHGEYNFNIALIKSLMSFLVVCAHFWLIDDDMPHLQTAVSFFTLAAAPVFFIMSFFLTRNLYSGRDPKMLGKRIWRLWFPQLFWAVFYYLGFRLVNILIGINYSGRYTFIFVKPLNLILQILMGSDGFLAPQMWFNFVSIILTLILFTAFCFAREKGRIVLIILFILSLLLQYTGINYGFFAPYGFNVSYAAGRVAECLPFAVAGFFIADMNILGALKSKKIITAGCCAAIMTASAFLKDITDPSYGFVYEGVSLLFFSAALFVLLSVIPLDNCPETLKRIIKFTSRLSMGVYCVHYFIGYLWDLILCKALDIKSDTLIECLIVYLISLAVSYLISLIPFKTVRSLVT